MKKIMMILMIAIAATSVVFGQTKMSDAEKTKAQLIKLEKQAWESWKNSNGSYFQSYLADSVVVVRASGTFDKAQVVKSFSSGDCEVRSVSLDDFKLVMPQEKTAILTYRAVQDVTCGGMILPSTVWASTVLIKKNGNWLATFHQETPAAQ